MFGFTQLLSATKRGSCFLVRWIEINNIKVITGNKRGKFISGEDADKFIKYSEDSFRRVNYKDLPTLTKEQLEIIDGILISDAWINEPKSGRKARVSIEQSIIHYGWLEYLQNKLQPYSRSISKHNRKEHKPMIRGREIKGKESFTFYTANHPVFNMMRNRWYPNGNKIVPKDIEITPLMLSMWMCGDGVNNPTGRSITFCTDDFTWEDCEFLCSKLENQFGFKASVNKSSNGDPHVYISSKNYLQVIEIMKPYILEIKDMEYKVSLDKFVEPYSGHYTKERHPWTKEDDIHKIHDLYESGLKVCEIAKKTGKDRTSVSYILKGKSHKKIKRNIIKVSNFQNTSGCTGVSWNKTLKAWRVRITINDKETYLGHFEDKNEAFNIRKTAEDILSSSGIEAFMSWKKSIGKKMNKNNTSGFKGVYKYGDCWLSQIAFKGNNGKYYQISLGVFDSIEDAKSIRLEAEQMLNKGVKNKEEYLKLREIKTLN